VVVVGALVVVVVVGWSVVVVVVGPGCDVVVVVLVAVEASQVGGAAHPLARYRPGSSTDAVVQVEQYTSVPIVRRILTVPCRASSRSIPDRRARTLRIDPLRIRACFTGDGPAGASGLENVYCVPVPLADQLPAGRSRVTS